MPGMWNLRITGLVKPKRMLRSPRLPATQCGAGKANWLSLNPRPKPKRSGRFLGKGYTVRASVGHVRDLLRSDLSVDVENNFTPKYRVPNEKRAVVKELKSLAKKAEEIFLATDPDREGEAIAWHLMEAAEIEPKLIQAGGFP